MEKFKFCPECGKTALSFDKFRSVICNACGFHFFFNVSAAVVAMIENDNKELLLTRRNKEPYKHMLDLPGGFMEFDESGEAALRREIKEEINLDVIEMHYRGSLPGEYFYDGIAYQVVNIVFRCSVEDFSKVRLSDEISECIFLARHEIDVDQIGINAIKTIIDEYG